MVGTLSRTESREVTIHDLGVEVPQTLDQALSDFVDARPRLLDLAYRILGSANEAEDVVQEAWLRWQATDRSVVRNPPAFLATVASRLALNLAQSARHRREVYADPGTLDPVDLSMGPEGLAERRDAVDAVLSLLMHSLNPTERSAYVLREAFDYPYETIAAILLLNTPHVRQLVRRARERIGADRRQLVYAAADR